MCYSVVSSVIQNFCVFGEGFCCFREEGFWHITHWLMELMGGPGLTESKSVWATSGVWSIPAGLVARGAKLLIKQAHACRYTYRLSSLPDLVLISKSKYLYLLATARVCVCIALTVYWCLPDCWSLIAEFMRGSSLPVLCLCVRVTLPQWSGSFLLLQSSKMFHTNFFSLSNAEVIFRKAKRNLIFTIIIIIMFFYSTYSI